MVKRVLVTGATGFVGRTALQPLLARGFEVHAVSRAPEGAPAGVKWHRADLLEASGLERIAADVGATHLLHFAWYTEHGKFWDALENADWVRASARLVRAFAAAGGQRVVVAGTCAEYDHPLSRYGESKDALRQLLEAQARRAGFGLAWGRIFFPYGPGEKPDRLIPSTARALLADATVECLSATRVVDLIYIEDVGEAFTALLDSAVAGVLDIGSGQGVELGAALRRFEQLAGRNGVVEFAEAPGETPRLVADTRMLERDLLWRPRVTLDEGLRRTLDWWREQVALVEVRT